MTRSSVSLTQAYGSLANYKGFQGALSAQLNAVLTRTADTGQVNWNTIATEPTVTRDYEVFAFNDSLQATYPIYVRFDYIGGSGTTNRVNVSVGTTTDGAGNLGGVTVASAALHAFGGGNVRTAYVSSDGSYLNLVYNVNPGGTGIDAFAAVVIERTRNTDGTINNHGYMVWRWSPTLEVGVATSTYYAGTTSRSFAAGATQPATVFDYGAFIPNIAGASTYFSVDTAYAFPCYGWAPWPEGASKALLLGVASDFPRASEITLNHYGADMKFLSIGPSSPQTYVPYMSAVNTPASKTIYAPLFRWE